MTTGTIIFLVAVGLLIQLGIVCAAIYIMFEKEKKYSYIQTALIAKMAKAQGVNEEEIRQLFIKERLRILL